jgi:hypothetical protein
MYQKLTYLFAALTVISAGTAFYYHGQYQGIAANPEVFVREQAEAQAIAIAAEVSQIVDLPQGEVPVIATVTDPTKLADQPFFKNAKIGDQVLIYQTAAKAYLYDPAAKKVLEVSDLNLGAGQQNAATAGAAVTGQ